MDKYLPPNRSLSLRTITTPKDTNATGDIAAGWLVDHMDMAASTMASRTSHGRVTSVSIETLHFHKPVHVGDEVSIYTEVQRMGHSSMHIKVEVIAKRAVSEEEMPVTDGVFVYVAIDEDYTPRTIHH